MKMRKKLDAPLPLRVLGPLESIQGNSSDSEEVSLSGN